MIRALAILSVTLAGCELLADIPNPTVVPPADTMIDTDTVQLECTDNAACTMVGKGICDLTTNTCGGCVLDSECPSNVCLMDGTCADPSRFVYAAAGGSSDVCTMAMPCSVDTAVTKLTPAKDIVKLAPGVYARAGTLTMLIAGTIAGGGSTFNVTATAGTAFGILAMGVPIRVIGLTMNVAATNMAVRCVAVGGELHLARMTISGGSGAIFSQCPVEIDRTLVTGATAYALHVNGGTALIRNSYFVAHGTDPDYPIGAVHLLNVPSGTVEHVTIANNGSQGPAGLRCPTSPTLVIRNIISWGNTAPGIDPLCTVTNSVVEAGYTGGSANVSMNPMFVDPAMGNFHLMMMSPAAEKGTPAAMFGIDRDGQDRPLPEGSNPDPGADEIP